MDRWHEDADPPVEAVETAEHFASAEYRLLAAEVVEEVAWLAEAVPQEPNQRQYPRYREAS